VITATNGTAHLHADNHNGHHLVPRYRTVVIVPAYNEERFIGSVVLLAKQYADMVLVVDDGSADGTAEVAATAGARVIRHEQNKGKGAALDTGFRKARELNPDVVLTIDADGQHLTQEIQAVAAPVLLGQADIVVGSRYIEKRSDVPLHRVAGHQVFNFLTNQAAGVSVTDSQSGFRAFSRRALQTISFHSNGFSVESEMQFIARESQLKVMEVPITIKYLDKPKRSVVRHGLMVLNGLLKLIGQYRPMLFGGLLGLFLLLVAGAWSIWIVELYRQNHQLAVGYALISVILFVISNTVLTASFILHSIKGLLREMRLELLQ
jgi:glycosyltransferase involved in cell wall biosynthesis